ncbi:uncharacterized protein ZBAI_09549 [Zygosaccharomyces bailii ISA1307]|nr:uncharacterized protein ZBAI_09549 [Zygosaccharomyces bailii ISA1307]
MEEHQHPINDFASLDAISLEGPSPLTEYGFLGEPSIMTLEANSSELKSKRDSSNLCEEDLKQIKRAQNRAAQRAFRERKEARLRALEQDLQQSEQHRKALAQELEELRKENLELSSKEKLMLEDEALQTLESDGTTFSFSAEYENHHHELLHQTRQYHDNFMKEQRSYYDESGRQILTISATWDYLHRLSEKQDLNIPVVLKQLEGKEVCHGFGAAYPRVVIDHIVQQQSSQINDHV